MLSRRCPGTLFLDDGICARGGFYAMAAELFLRGGMGPAAIDDRFPVFAVVVWTNSKKPGWSAANCGGYPYAGIRPARTTRNAL